MIVGAALIVVGLFVGTGDWLRKRERDLGYVGFFDSFLVDVGAGSTVVEHTACEHPE